MDRTPLLTVGLPVAALTASLLILLRRRNKSLAVDRGFLESAKLSEADFFALLSGADIGLPDLTSSPFAAIVYQSFADGNGGVTLSKAREAASLISRVQKLFARINGGQPISRDLFEHVEKANVMDLLMGPGTWAKVNGMNGTKPSLQRRTTTKDVVAQRRRELYDTVDVSGDGLLDEGEFTTMCLAYAFIARAFAAESGEAGHLTREGLGRTLARIGFVDVARVMQGQLADAVLRRFDNNADGIISFTEFLQGSWRLLRPVTWQFQMQGVNGWPGWPCLAANANLDFTERCAALSKAVSTLTTGDVLLMRIDDPLGKYIQFALDSPWNHAAVCVTVKRPYSNKLLQGTPNEKTESLLQRYPFRRSTHRFCSPGYCRCFDSSEGDDFHLSRLSGTAQTMLLESTGEGVHLYDLAHRLFESGYLDKFSALAVRRLKLSPEHHDTAATHERAIDFISQVRGSLFSTAEDEMKNALDFHNHRQRRSTSLRHQDSASSESSVRSLGNLDESERSHFCSKAVAAFYQHMGWMGEEEREAESVMPCDFDDTHSSKPFARPVTLRDGLGEFMPLEMIWSANEEEVVLPLRPPKKKRG